MDCLPAACVMGAFSGILILAIICAAIHWVIQQHHLQAQGAALMMNVPDTLAA
jgi:hypothetical protein